MRKCFANPTSSHWNADASELTSSRPSGFPKSQLTLNRLIFFLCPPRAGHTYMYTNNCRRAKPSSAKGRCVFSALREISEQIADDSSHVILSSCLQKADGPSMVQKHPCSLCSPSRGFFSIFIVTQDYSCLPNPQIKYFLMYVWPLLALVANPTTTKQIGPDISLSLEITCGKSLCCKFFFTKEILRFFLSL